jgi:type 2 lantibiotic biosynthesis protein LanM
MIAMLSCSDTDLASRYQPPLWLMELTRSAFDTHDEDTQEPPSWGCAHLFFVQALAPIIESAKSRLQFRLGSIAQSSHGQLFDPQKLSEDLLASLTNKVERMLLRAAVLELNIARLSGELKGDDSISRFQSFVRSLATSAGRRRFLTAYPVLGRQIVTAIRTWLRSSSNLAQHIADDWVAINTVFSPGSPLGPVTRVVPDLGDAHRGGATVTLVSWANGVSVVYKPRTSTIDGHFQQLLQWFNDQGIRHKFLILNCLARSNHGWMSFVEASPPTDELALQRYYYRQGCLIAILYLLNATDFHAENIITAGEHPVPVDLETLIQPSFTNLSDSPADPRIEALRFIDNSALMTGVLPENSPLDHEAGADPSPLGYVAGSLSPLAVPVLINAGSDLMRIELRRVPLSPLANLSLREVEPEYLVSHIDHILEGFADIYKLCLSHRRDLLNGPLAVFRGDETRVVIRPTVWYETLLQTSFHPDVLRDALDRERHFDALWRDMPRQPELVPCIKHERKDLWRGDIPVFNARTDRGSLYDSDGRVVSGIRLQSGRQRLEVRVANLSQIDLKRQAWIIRAALSRTAIARIDELPRPILHDLSLSAHMKSEALVAAAETVGRHLSEIAFQSSSCAQWITVRYENSGSRPIRVLEADLYDGLVGIALFLGWLAKLTNENAYKTLSVRAWNAARSEVERGTLTNLGMSGLGGAIYGFSQLGRLWEDHSVLDLSHKCASKVAEMIEADDQFDFMAGSAGAISGLAALNDVDPQDYILELVRLCADHLVGRASSRPEGISWLPRTLKSAGTTSGPLSGFAHGGAGIAIALFKAAELLNDARYLKVARQAISLEQTSFEPDRGIWRELRDNRTLGLLRAPRSGFWCRGGIGIGLSRILCLTLLEPESLATARQEIDSALEMAIAQRRSNDSLCHGDVGNLELMLQAASVFDMPYWREMAESRAAGVVASINENGLRCGYPFGVEVPGLMVGLAGIGYGLLRVASPDRVPAVLALSPSLGGGLARGYQAIFVPLAAPLSRAK